MGKSFKPERSVEETVKSKKKEKRVADGVDEGETAAFDGQVEEAAKEEAKAARKKDKKKAAAAAAAAEEEEEALRLRKAEKKSKKAAAAAAEAEAEPDVKKQAEAETEMENNDETHRLWKEEKKARKAAAAAAEAEAAVENDNEARRRRKEEKKARKAAAEAEAEAEAAAAAEAEAEAEAEAKKLRKEAKKKRKAEAAQVNQAEDDEMEISAKRQKLVEMKTKVGESAAEPSAKRNKIDDKVAVARTVISDAKAARADFADVHVTGSGAHMIKPWSRFEDLPKDCFSSGVQDFLVKDKGFAEPTVIQAHCWPIASGKRDLIGIAKTGSGKTLAYLLPAFPSLLSSKMQSSSKTSGPFVLVLAPTRELAMQIEQEAAAFERSLGLRTVCVYGGTGKGPQIGALSQRTDIVVATAGRLNDFLKSVQHKTGKPVISLSSVSYVVLDEADRMLDMGFEPQIREIFSYIPASRQTLLFSATWPKEIRALASEFLTDPLHVRVGATDTFQGNRDVQQRVLLLESDGKFAVDPATQSRELRKILKEHDGQMILVFCGMKKTAAAVAAELQKEGVNATGIHGDMDQPSRDEALLSFKEGRVKVLVATDVAARGLDVQGVAVVVNYDPAKELDDHVHRIGRTGRAGQSGLAYTMIAQDDSRGAKIVAEVMRSSNQAVPADLEELASWADSGGRKATRTSYWKNAWSKSRW